MSTTTTTLFILLATVAVSFSSSSSCCECSKGVDSGSDLFSFSGAAASDCSRCCKSFSSEYSSGSTRSTETCSSHSSILRKAPCDGQQQQEDAEVGAAAPASCGQCNINLGYHDRVDCCSKQGASCKFLEAYYPTRPEGLCVEQQQQQKQQQAEVSVCPGCSATPTRAACALIHGCCKCCAEPNPCAQVALQ